ncbi:adenosine A2a receptor b [Kryptolebias marmoratus]|uniref:Adenosine A2a receptor n=1 Tax=Kryptolebias marmoratus TaxID=37003 RepID=A0A3Q3AYW5_KRYMA|nr:adenosine A2a receptor b [Kryptolebias marmoratus]XP_024860496.1 adenosine A2a receptor b [Kryptolebias marmoratus]XP_024860497.1 adenosine A2a receptor b [Kryptolebias marmoratus]
MLRNYQVVYIGLELLIALLAVAGNVLVCWAVCLNSNLQSITNFFVVSLAVADIAVGLLAIPFAITISVGFCADFYGCLFIACFVLVLTQSSIFSLLAIAIDRYIAIKNPLRYHSLVTGQRAKFIIALCWILSVGIGLTPMFGWNTGWNSSITTEGNISCPEGMTQCLFEKVVTLNYMVYFNFFGCVLVPLLVMLVIYVNIFMVALRQLRLMNVKVEHTLTPGQKVPASSSSRSVLQKEVHAAKSLAIIVGLFALCWLPLHIINCFNHLCQGCKRPHIWVMNIAIILSHANSVVNPFIYAYRIREFRQTFRKIFYQHILKSRQELGVENADGRGVGSNSIRRTSQSSKEGSTCGTVVNSYILDPFPDQTRHNDAHELSSCWTSSSDNAPSSYVPNGHHVTSGTMTYSSQDASKSVMCLQEAAGVLELKDGGSCIAFANIQTHSPNQTDCTCSTNITEVS